MPRHDMRIFSSLTLAYYCLMIVLMRRLEWLGATARQVGQDRWLAGLKANHRSATRCRPDMENFSEISSLQLYMKNS